MHQQTYSYLLAFFLGLGIAGVAFEQPVQDAAGGNMLYTAKLGEEARLYHFDKVRLKRADTIPVWTSTEALAQYHHRCHDRLKEQPQWAQSVGKAREQLERAAAQALERVALERGDLLELPAMTKVRVMAYGTFSVADEQRIRSPDDDDHLYDPTLDRYLVEVLDTPHQGKLVWARRFDVRVLSSREFKTGPPKPVHKKAPARGQPDQLSDQPVLRVLASRWNHTPDGCSIDITAQVRNLCDRYMSSPVAFITYKDKAGKTIKVERWNIPEMAPGEVTEFTATHGLDRRMHKYDLGFTAVIGGETTTITVVKGR